MTLLIDWNTEKQVKLAFFPLLLFFASSCMRCSFSHPSLPIERKSWIDFGRPESVVAAQTDSKNLTSKIAVCFAGRFSRKSHLRCLLLKKWSVFRTEQLTERISTLCFVRLWANVSCVSGDPNRSSDPHVRNALSRHSRSLGHQRSRD